MIRKSQLNGGIGKRILGCRNSKCKGPGVGKDLACSVFNGVQCGNVEDKMGNRKRKGPRGSQGHLTSATNPFTC